MAEKISIASGMLVADICGVENVGHLDVEKKLCKI